MGTDMLEKGTFVTDRYEIVEKVGSGGMADVYKAKDRKLNRFVALKVLKSEFREDNNFVGKFRTEAQAAAGLEHPNVINIYDVGSEHGFSYIVMEFVEGITLKEYIKRKGKLSYKEALSIAIQVSRGIEAAHEKNIVHRDIKPQNIIISNDGKVKVTDFGIARASTSNTIHSEAMGSVHYVSPEQARNGYVSEKSDIYSLGVVMYEMVTGRVPFDGDSTVEIAIKHLKDEITNPTTYAPDLPVSLEKIILKCTQKSADRRYTSMESLLSDLRRSLLHPNEDFVTDSSLGDETRAISEEELQQIQNYGEEQTEETGVSDESDVYEDEYEDEDGEVHSRMEKIVIVMGIIAAVVIVIIVIVLLKNTTGLFSANKDTDTEDSAVEEVVETVYTMTDLSGLTISEAEELLDEYGITVYKSGTEASSEYEEGEIIEQDIAEGTEVEEGTTVHVIVSSGEEAQEVSVINVIGLSQSDAVAALSALGLETEIDYEYSSSVAAGEVSSQSPTGGTSAYEGDTVTLYISQGIEGVSVPNVTGKTQSEATATLEAQGFTVEVEEAYSSDVKEGKVISQSVEAGTTADDGSTITITVSLGEETILYTYSEIITLPDDLDVISATIQLYADDDGSLIKEWTDITSFPKTITVKKITNYASGQLRIIWTYQDSDGNSQKEAEERSVKFTKTS